MAHDITKTLLFFFETEGFSSFLDDIFIAFVF